MNPFAEDVAIGLSAEAKSLPAKYFYDAAGSAIFQEIMAMPEYYLTQCEWEILTEQAGAILGALRFSSAFDVVELGAGDGKKTLAMLDRWAALGASFRYLPIDVSAMALDDLASNAAAMGAPFEVLPQVGDYFAGIRELPRQRPRLFLFLGANIGNYDPTQCLLLLAQVKAVMQPGDCLMVGFDLQKAPAIIQAAYDDPHGITKRFNLNLLARINRELGGHFALDKFDFKCIYTPETGALNSYLVSLAAQTVAIDSLGQSFSFRAGEVIHTELSKKYSAVEIAALAAATGLAHVADYHDARHYFVDSLWRLEKA